MLLNCQNLNIDTLKKNNLTLNEHFVLLIIWSFENKQKDCFISIDKMALFLNVSTRTIDNIIKSLKRKGFIFTNKNEKHLSTLGTFYCKSIFCFRSYKPKKREIIKPSWYDDYQNQVETKKDQNKPVLSNDELNELVNELFKD